MLLETRPTTQGLVSIPSENPLLLESMKPFSRAQIREFVAGQAQLLDTENCRSILDVGCGYRTNEPEVLSAFGGQLKPLYVAFDHTANFDKPIDPNAKINLVAAANLMPFQDQSFDAVICTEVLEHAESDIAVLDEISRVLSDNGKLILTVPGKDVPLHEKLPHQKDYRRYDQDGVRSLLSLFGFGEIFTISALNPEGLETNILATAVRQS